MQPYSPKMDAVSDPVDSVRARSKILYKSHLNVGQLFIYYVTQAYSSSVYDSLVIFCNLYNG